MRIKKALFLGTLCTAVSGMSLFAQAGVSYAKSAEKTTEAASSEEAESEEETSEEVTYPITIEHAFGETVIESKPERIATIGSGKSGYSTCTWRCTSWCFSSKLRNGNR